MSKKLDKTNIQAVAPVEVIAAKDGKKERTFIMDAYTGDAIRVGRWWPGIVDVAGISWTDKPRPILLNHNVELRAGVSTEFLVSDGHLVVKGKLLDSPIGNAIARDADSGFPWQASSGFSIDEYEYIDARDDSVFTANGREFTGEYFYARKTTVYEVSFVALGADDNTEVKVAMMAAGVQQGESKMDDNKKIESGKVNAPVPDIETKKAEALQASRQAEADEVRRVSNIKSITKAHLDIAEKAIVEGWDSTRTELEVLRAERASAPAPAIHVAKPVDRDVLTAALSMTFGVGEDELVKDIGEEAVVRARKMFKRSMGLKQLIVEAARLTGLSVDGMSNESLVTAAFSSSAVSGILGDSMNKALVAEFGRVSSSVTEIFATREVPDFKTVKSYSLNVAGDYGKIADDGELKSASLTQTEYSAGLDTYGEILALTRQMIINDDLSAFAALPRAEAMRAANKLARVAFGILLANSGSFFSPSNGNYESGTSSALSITSFQTALQDIEEMQTNDGQPTRLTPRYLLVPPALKATALQLMKSTKLITGEDDTQGDFNTVAGSADVVSEAYLSSAFGLTNASDVGWYVLTDPKIVSVLQILFLRGKRTPTIEQVQMTGSTLGVFFRSFFDFGVAQYVEQAGVFSKGEA